jgi:sialate O-acetylesterase
MKAGGPFTLAISGRNRIVCTNVLIGEVWICSGQSNMERHLGLQQGQKPIDNWEQEVRDANYPRIRQFYVVKTISYTPKSTEQGGWSVCTPDTVTDFTAVGYFFGRDLYQARRVPIGLIHSSWGGTPAEAWTSEPALRAMPDFAAPLAQLRQLVADPAGAAREAQSRLDAWYAGKDSGANADPP